MQKKKNNMKAKDNEILSQQIQQLNTNRLKSIF